MKQKENQRILGKHVRVLNDSRKTNLNNNDLVVGVSGSGKTGGYVIPNLRCCQESIYVADTKGLLYKQYAKDLEQVGYKVYLIDFVHPEYSRGYNPLDYIRPGRLPDSCREQDILTIAASMIPVRIYSEPFWEESAQVVLASLIAFAKEALPYEEQNLISVCKLNRVLGTPEGERIFAELEAEFPESFAVKKYKEYRNVFNAEKTWACISQVVNRALGAYDIYEVKEMFRNRDGFHIADTGREKSAVFVHISDTDRSFDGLINVFYTQVFQELCADADKMPDGRLKIPVRIILDDFATNIYIPNFDKLISVIRSRDISVSIILQSISQLETLYTTAEAKTILNGCDHLLYLGGQDVDTAIYIGAKANRTVDHILQMGVQEAYLFTRGETPKKIEKYPPYETVR